MNDIGPGDWVECVDAAPHAHPLNSSLIPPYTGLVLGQLYCVLSVEVVPYNSLIGIRLVGVLNPPEHIGFVRGVYAIERFRPIRSDITSIERLLKVPTKIKELV